MHIFIPQVFTEGLCSRSYPRLGRQSYKQVGPQVFCPLRSYSLTGKTDVEHGSTSGMGVANGTPTMTGQPVMEAPASPERSGRAPGVGRLSWRKGSTPVISEKLRSEGQCSFFKSILQALDLTSACKQLQNHTRYI